MAFLYKQATIEDLDILTETRMIIIFTDNRFCQTFRNQFIRYLKDYNQF